MIERPISLAFIGKADAAVGEEVKLGINIWPKPTDGSGALAADAELHRLIIGPAASYKAWGFVSLAFDEKPVITCGIPTAFDDTGRVLFFGLLNHRVVARVCQRIAITLRRLRKGVPISGIVMIGRDP